MPLRKVANSTTSLLIVRCGVGHCGVTGFRSLTNTALSNFALLAQLPVLSRHLPFNRSFMHSLALARLFIRSSIYPFIDSPVHGMASPLSPDGGDVDCGLMLGTLHGTLMVLYMTGS